MTRYNITAERTNGTQFTDTVYAADEKTARRDFNEIYRHADKPKIISVVALGDGYQASKAQEREALAEIRSIVESQRMRNTLSPKHFRRRYASTETPPQSRHNLTRSQTDFQLSSEMLNNGRNEK